MSDTNTHASTVKSVPSQSSSRNLSSTGSDFRAGHTGHLYSQPIVPVSGLLSRSLKPSGQLPLLEPELPALPALPELPALPALPEEPDEPDEPDEPAEPAVPAVPAPPPLPAVPADPAEPPAPLD